MPATIVALTAMTEPACFINVDLKVSIAVSTSVLDGGATAGSVGDIVFGGAVMGLGVLGGTRSDEHYGGWGHAIV